MAYNLKSLITILQKILKPDQELSNFDQVKPQLTSLLELAASVKLILEKSLLSNTPQMERLESEIRDTAHEAEDIIESYMVDQMMPETSTSEILPPDVDQLIQRLHSVKELVMKSIQISPASSSSSSSSSAAAASSSSPATNTVVGLDQDLMQLMDRLTGLGSKLEIIPIVGMGGIGKTTLARTLYDDQTIVSHFDICGWTTISQGCNVRAILLGLLSCIYKELTTPDLLEEEDYELKELIYKKLYGRRYLIVLDDMWSTDSWDYVRMCFPRNNNRSRIVITSRDSNVGREVVGSGGFQHQMNLLPESESWSLLAEKVFGRKTECPAELESIGRKIARDCGGLPLAIHVIGGVLSEAEAGRSRHVWEHVVNDVRAAIAEKDEQFSNILSLSYNHLPSHLKPCFLYMGAFPEDYKVSASRLISLWIAEGFAEAEGYLTALVERNLLTVRQRKSNGKPKSYGIHDLLRDLCITKAKQEKFLQVTAPTPARATFHGPRRLSAHQHFQFRHLDDFAFSSTRSFIWHEPVSFAFLSGFFHVSRLVKVLDVVGVKDLREFPSKILQLVNLRYLALSCCSGLPTLEISRFRNLQTLIAVGGMGVVEIPSEIWELPELRCLKLKNSTMRYAGGCDEGRRSFVRDKLQTISTIQLHKLSEIDFFTSFPNMKSLRLDSAGYDQSESCARDLLRHLHKLEHLFVKECWELEDIPCGIGEIPTLQLIQLTYCSTSVVASAKQIQEVQQSDYENYDIRLSIYP